MALQSRYHLAYVPTVREEPRIRATVKDLDVAGQIFDLLIAEFHFSMFWESEIEYDIYHSAYEQWRMAELAKFVKDTLAAAARTADVLRRKIDVRRQFRISVTLGALTTLTLIGAVANLFNLSRQEWDNFEMPYNPFLAENVHNYLSYH